MAFLTKDTKKNPIERIVSDRVSAVMGDFFFLACPGCKCKIIIIRSLKYQQAKYEEI